MSGVETLLPPVDVPFVGIAGFWHLDKLAARRLSIDGLIFELEEEELLEVLEVVLMFGLLMQVSKSPLVLIILFV